MSDDKTGIHNTDTCSCQICTWARNVVEQREYREWSVEVELEGFRAKYGDEALAQTVDRFMTERAIF